MVTATPMGKPCAVSGAMIMCTLRSRAVHADRWSRRRPIVEGRPVATITDVAPGANIAAVRHVPVAGEPHGRRGHRRRARGAHADAVRAGGDGAVDADGAADHGGRHPVLVAGSTCICAYGGSSR